ncbi:hypothetical protein C3F09_10890, partial [candidate division GN15 bacterium]
MTGSNLNDRLKRVGQHISSGQKASRSLPSRYGKLAEAVNGELVHTQSGTFVSVTTVFPATHFHGSVLLEDVIQSETYPLSAFTAKDDPGEVNPANLIFLDTETTGLGGAGTVPFLVGVGKITDDGFEITQYLIPDYTDETGMLETLLEEIDVQATLVTYNGGAFDIPLLRDRVIINRVARDFGSDGHHIDLLHPTRRLFKRRIKDCSLVNAEQQLLGFFRESDTPGYLIPSIYFDWLSTEDSQRLPGVMEHNRLDILSLHFLMAHIHRAFVTEGDSLRAGEDLYSLSRVYRRRSHHDKALKCCDRLKAVQPEMTEEMLFFHAQTLKKVGEWTQAVEMWQQLSSG